MYTVKLKDIVYSKQAFEKLVNTRFPIKVSYWLSRYLAVINREISAFDQQRVSLIRNIGVEGENNSFSIPEDQREEFSKQVSELLNEEVSIDFNRIKLSDLIGYVDLTPIEMEFLVSFIDNDTSD